MYYLARKKANYLRSLGVLKEAKTTNPNILTKTGIMVGLGEKIDEVLRVMEDLREVNCDVITIGQYLSPSSDHIPVAEYVSLEVFNLYERKARNYGFRHVRSGPFVRSSFLAGDILN
jgi:lipoic acid synthetase